MGEAPALFGDDFQIEPSNGVLLKSKGSEITTIDGDKYAIGGTYDDSAQFIEVRIFDRSSGEWIVPVVLGTKPKQSHGHSVVFLNDDRVLVLKAGSSPDDSIWFLEVDTEFVREQKKKYEKEVVAWSKGVIGKVEKPIVISGPSGVGKGTLIAKLIKEFPSMFGFSVSHTTRAPRDKEIDGVHYHFSERSAMEKDIKDGKFLEFASVHGNLYGTSVEAVKVVADEGKRCILDIDVQGARSVRASSLEAVFIFICPPSVEELEKRLRERGTETEEQIQKRLRNAKAELEAGRASGLFDHILKNDDLDTCYKKLKKHLGLDGIIGTTPKLSSELIELPLDHPLSKIDNKIFISCKTQNSQDFPRFVLDVSSLNGGAPGRTRGLTMHAMDPFSNGSDELKKLS